MMVMSSASDLRVVVIGSGRIGLQTARLLDNRGHDVVIVERNPNRVQKVAEEYIATIIEGDATNIAVLEQVNFEAADAVAAMTDTMGTNFTVCTLAKEINPSIRTVMRSIYGTGNYARYADEIVVPEQAGARTTVNTIESDVRIIEDTTSELSVLEIRVAPTAPVAGRSLDEISLPRGSVVISDIDESRIATGDTELQPDKTYIVATEPEVTDEVRRLFRG